MLHSVIDDQASKRPAKTAFVQGHRSVSYRELSRNVTRLASFLIEAGVRKGDRIGILSENSPEYVSGYFGIQKTGAIAVDINYQYSVREIRKILAHCLPTAIIVEGKYLGGIADVVGASTVRTIIVVNSRLKKPSHPPAASNSFFRNMQCVSFEEIIDNEAVSSIYPIVSPNDIAAIIYTSGTTGEPKGVMLTHDNFLSNAYSIVSYLRLTEYDSVMAILPFCYSFGKSLLTTHLMVGGTIVLENSFMYPDIVLKKMAEEEVTGFAGVPSTFAILLNRSTIRNYQFAKLRYVAQAGGAMPVRHALELSNMLSNSSVYIMYGQTEATARLTYLEPRDLIRKAGSIGKAIPGVTIELIKEDGTTAKNGEEGEIVAMGRNIMAGYWNNQEETRKALRGGKLFTGDIARMDGEGYLYIVGRRSDMIKSGAHRISPKEIEEVIVEINEVHEAVVVGIDDDILGEAIKAFVVLKHGHIRNANSIQRYCRDRLAPFKIPKEVVFVSDLPKTSSGKVRRHLLKCGAISLNK
jgi:long-chain acyl-CoA synthetase